MMPFPGGIDSLSNGTLLFSAGAAFFYLLMQARPPSWRRTVAKAGAIVLLAVLTLLEGGPFLLAAALLFSAIDRDEIRSNRPDCINAIDSKKMERNAGGKPPHTFPHPAPGDAFLAHDGERPLLSGLASFLAAHLLYIALFVTEGGGSEILSAQSWRIVPPVVVVAAVLLFALRLLPAITPALRGPALIYTALIFALVLTAATVPAPLVMLGAGLLATSIALHAAGRFLLSHHTAWREAAVPAVWTLYYLAQLLLTLGFLL